MPSSSDPRVPSAEPSAPVVVRTAHTRGRGPGQPSASPDGGEESAPAPGPADAVETDVVAVERLVAGGYGLGRLPSGRVVLVEGTAPGDVVRLRESSRGRFSGDLLVPSSDRWDHPCSAARAGCGGCDLHFIEPRSLIDSKLGIVADAFRRIGRLAVDPQPGPTLATAGYRTSMRFLVSDGQLALRRAASHDAVGAAACVVAHPLMADLLALEWPDEIDEVTVRVGAATGERMVVVEGGELAGGLTHLPADVGIATPRSKDAFLHESVRGVRFRISPASFFQSRHDGAEALADLVLAAADEFLGDRTRAEVLDLCCGVGLFAGLIANRYAGWSVTAVESARSSIRDADSNLARLNARVVHSSMARFRPQAADLVIADPPRSGLAKDGVAVVRRADPQLVVLVSCDAACAGRDARLIAALGYSVESVTVLDMFPYTHHVEVVTVLRRLARMT